MNDRVRYLFKNVGILTISNFASKILVFLLVPLYTSVLSTGQVGIYDLIVTTVNLLFPIFTLNIVDAVMRFSMEEGRSREHIASTGFVYVSLSILPVVCFLFIVNQVDILQHIRGLKFYILLYYISYVLNQFFIQFAKGLERVADMGIAGVVGTIVMLLFNILFLLVLKWGLEGFFIANALSQAIPAMFLIIRIRAWKYIGCNKFDSQLNKEMLAYCVPLIATVVGWWVNSAADRYVVAFFCGVAANGLLSVAYKIPQIMVTLQSIFIQAWQITAIKEYGKQDTSNFYGKSLITLNTVMSLAGALLIVLTKPLGHILYAKEFFAAWEYVPFLIISCVLNAASGVLGPILSAKKDSKAMAMSAVYGTGVNFVMNIFLVYFIGIQGATIATVISSYIIYAVRKKSAGEEIDFEKYWIVPLTWSLLCAQAVLEIYTPFWWAEVMLIVTILLINRKVLMEILIISKSILHC